MFSRILIPLIANNKLQSVKWVESLSHVSSRQCQENQIRTIPGLSSITHAANVRRLSRCDVLILAENGLAGWEWDGAWLGPTPSYSRVISVLCVSARQVWLIATSEFLWKTLFPHLWFSFDKGRAAVHPCFLSPPVALFARFCQVIASLLRVYTPLPFSCATHKKILHRPKCCF